MSSIYPELQKELISLQEGIASMTMKLKVPVPQKVKENIMNEVKNTPQDAPLKVVQDASEKRMAKTSNAKMHYVGYAAAVIAMLFLGVQYFSSLNESKQLAAELKQTKEQLSQEYQNQLAEMEGVLDQSKEENELLTSADTKTVILGGSDFSPASKARVLWNQSKEAYLFLADELPKPSEGMQYQLWAIADGEPISIALLNENEDIRSPQNLSLQSVQAFAITLEPEGGVESPNLERLVVIGNT